ncbi:MAG: hypothetical protein COT25_02605 [Candidatus Kerfeldbacteria bacterium CG08_land_8_20_14_0_20_42_7]|uniref:DUF8128 domain-containing protein n=1 Tax=Candidatus Kerfeldbacteria bacterium CG08_land_8_20_14_0_20_42_7 TaxID=2014245 RepID=A0A2H0YSQ3_9BACT|nr:MAG: hypothetical protein COT25_02605 [Candidatus Kerfeldbacteria bacterium CG08_land_8_20_14_0_20_42_7]
MLDFSFIVEVNNPFTAMVILFQAGGWVAFAMLGLWMVKQSWLNWRQSIWEKSIQYVLLAVDIPKENEQTPKALEYFFDHLTGFDKNPTLQEKYIEGFMPTRVTLELVSIGGYVQFLIHTPVKFRDLVEAALYAEYPDAELTEVEDYINGVPKPDDFATSHPAKGWKFWGSEIAFYRPNPYPIRTYVEFEHMLTRELKDPMASILEMLGRMGPDEQVWIQWVMQTAPRDWQEESKQLVKKLIGENTNKKSGAFFLDIPQQVLQGSVESITASVIDPMDFTTHDSVDSNTQKNRLMQMTPGEIGIVQAIERKAAKAAFKVRGRMCYFAKEHAFSKARGVSGVYGALKQFNTNHMNGFAPPPKSKTEAWYVLANYRTRQRMRMLLAGYRSRSNWAGHKSMILNTEELASIWHFPDLSVKAQLVQKTMSKKSSPPTSTPFEGSFQTVQPIDASQEKTAGRKSSAPENLPLT